uniref:Axonemal dynein light chain domain containing 1 n=1 Tax=Myripristis murdjan TaxID=586833 RepID=A0A667WR44_9TELE
MGITKTPWREIVENLGERPDAIWHHPLGRKKYKYFLEQPTSLTGAGRSVKHTRRYSKPMYQTETLICQFQNGLWSSNFSVLVQDLSESLIPEEYHIVKNKGLQGLHFYEDKYTVQLQDEEQRLRVFPSLRPSSRVEVVQLMNMMDDMLEKAGVEQQCEELTELSQMQGLLELVRVEQNIYNIVFHELIRQVSVGCAERGQLLAKLRQRYQSLLERIPRRLKALHAETLAQRALDHRSCDMYIVLGHIAPLSVPCQPVCIRVLLSLVQTYHELYEMQRRRLEAQLLRLTEERDGWSQVTFSLALKVCVRCTVVSRLHVSEQGWAKTAEHCTIFLTHKVTLLLLHLQTVHTKFSSSSPPKLCSFQVKGTTKLSSSSFPPVHTLHCLLLHLQCTHCTVIFFTSKVTLQSILALHHFLLIHIKHLSFLALIQAYRSKYRCEQVQCILKVHCDLIT